MTISQRIRSQLFANNVADACAAVPVACSSPIPLSGSTSDVSSCKNTSGANSQSAALSSDAEDAERVLIRLPLTRPLPGGRKRPSRAKQNNLRLRGLGWSDDEHERFLRGLEVFPSGPWKHVAAFVGTRTTRQVMTHAQKYRQKIARRQRGLQGAVTLKLEAVEPAVARSASPPSADHLLEVFQFQTSAQYAQPVEVPVTMDEFRLIDELFAEPSWSIVNHLENDDELLLLDDLFTQSAAGGGSFAARSETLEADKLLAPWVTSTVATTLHQL